MSQLANKPATAVDDDPVGITEEAAIEWLRLEKGVSGGAAIRHLQDAWNSGNVHGWDNLVEVGRHGEVVLREGKPVRVPQRLSQITGDFVHDFRLHAGDLRWQTEQQLAKPPAEKAPKRPSSGHRGRPEAPYWSKVHEFIDDWLVENGCPQPGDGNQARLEALVAGRVDARTEEPPAKSTIRDHVVRRISRQKRNLAKAD